MQDRGEVIPKEEKKNGVEDTRVKRKEGYSMQGKPEKEFQQPPGPSEAVVDEFDLTRQCGQRGPNVRLAGTHRHRVCGLATR